jgi:hypothetical protein
MLVALRRSSRESGRARLEESGRAVTPARDLRGVRRRASCADRHDDAPRA